MPWEGQVRAAVLRHAGPARSGPLELTDVADPVVGPGQVSVSVTACGVCRTDLQLCEGDLVPRRLPVIPGHQIVGVVRDVGEGVTLAVGTRVGVAWLAGSCGRCAHCRSGRENLCEQSRFTGWDVDGGFATLAVADAGVVVPIPDQFGDTDAAPLLCGGVIGFRCLRAAGTRAGQRLGLFGFGASASLVIQVARYLGADVYVATRDVAEQQRARELGAVWAGGYDDPPPVPLDAAITFAPVGSVVVSALRSVDRGATVVVNAIHLDSIPSFPYELLWWERSLRSVANVTRADITGFLDVAARIPVVTRHSDYPLERANDALADLAAGRISGAAVLVP